MFVALRRQDELIGHNGRIRFWMVFSWQARVVVVLYREPWGKTPFTEVESNAIQWRRCFDKRPFLKMILMDDGPPPPWYPNEFIYGRYERLGIEGPRGGRFIKSASSGTRPRVERVSRAK